jgi:hypothetical protein
VLYVVPADDELRRQKGRRKQLGVATRYHIASAPTCDVIRIESTVGHNQFRELKVVLASLQESIVALGKGGEKFGADVFKGARNV